MAPAVGEEADLLQWGFTTLVQSYDTYHSGDKSGQSSRPLQDFATQMPQTSAKPEPRPAAPRPAASKSLFVGGLGGRGGSAASQESREQRGKASNAAPARAPKSEAEQLEDESEAQQPEWMAESGWTNASGRATGGEVRSRGERPHKDVSERSQPAPKKHTPVAERGPMPGPFATTDPWAQALQKGPSAPPAAAAPTEEPTSAEDYETWMAYYRECADYYKQCEATIAAQSGAEVPAPSAPSASTMPAASASAAAAPQVPAAAAAPAMPPASSASALNRASAAAAMAAAAAPPASYAGAMGGPLGANDQQSALLQQLAAAGLLAPGAGQQLAAAGLLPPTASAPGASNALYGSMYGHDALGRGAFPTAQGHPLLPPGGPWAQTGAMGAQLPGAGLMGFQAGGVAGFPGAAVQPGGLLGVGNAAVGGARGLGLDDEALANLLMSWYYSGYYTGHFAARQGR